MIRIYNAEHHRKLSDTLKELVGIVQQKEREPSTSIKEVHIFTDLDGQWLATIVYEEPNIK